MSLQLGGRHLWMSFLVVENLDESDQVILGRDFVRNLDVTIDLNDGLIRIKNPERKYEKKPPNKILINQAKVPIFHDRKVILKPNQAVVATLRMRNLNKLSNDRQVCLVPNPNKHEIEIDEGSVLHREGASRMTPHKPEACRKEIEMLMEYDMIEQSKSPWKQDREKTGFACELGLFQWKRMPFGLCKATATSQRLMAQALTKVTKKYGNLNMCYVDDVVIATPTLEDLIERLDEVFACMKQAGLKCKPSKCEILRDSIKYLGRLVDKHGVRPNPEAVEAVLTWKAPKTDIQLMNFLGFANYYRGFIKEYADKI
ncbi:uncharacterized protein LOC134839908 [Symsagittifera roscoffensis]|uniref:uncharacterized protein LOC134839908 n=1 Tax=Symsagittifera roscoffensis TaxID=84072 RepID=UPI00307B9206